ncbi:A-kinase anchor protein 14-like, partial [Oncorhynchus kisutch]|uniref:A-kinase anchor protein 14-like n=1 Tax=Oncorhynchus kisutch TaxID=8019 RepID=UPI0012DD75DB
MDERPSSTKLRASEIVKKCSGERTRCPRPPASSGRLTEYEFRNIEWITCKDFTIELGKVRIEEYIHTWEVHTSWLFSLVFLEETDHEFHKQYHYRAQWSIPTRHFARGGVLSSESNRLTHRPGETRFREKWLKDVIESKTLLQNCRLLA